NIPVFCSLGNFVSDYWQERARESLILRYDTSSSVFCKIPVTLNSYGIPEDHNSSKRLELGPFKGIVATLAEINSQRQRLRLEYLKELIKNGYKLKSKRKFLQWMIKRAIFLLKYYRLEKINPDVI